MLINLGKLAFLYPTVSLSGVRKPPRIPKNRVAQEIQKNLKVLEKKITEEEEINRKLITVKNGELIAYGNEI